MAAVPQQRQGSAAKAQAPRITTPAREGSGQVCWQVGTAKLHTHGTSASRAGKANRCTRSDAQVLTVQRPATMEITKVSQANEGVYLNLIQDYEAEFAGITKKIPNQQGLFELDTILSDTVTGFLCFVDQAPAGLAAISEDSPANFEIREFYIIPGFRGTGLGTRFAHLLWSMLPGHWQVKQIEGAEYASAFWRKALARFQGCSFQEDRYQDSYWGMVTRQSFTIDITKQT